MKNIALLGFGLFLLGCTTVDRVYAEDYAVVVGIDEYKQSGIRYLVGAKNDALAYRDILLLNGVKEKNIKFLDNEHATKESIQKALEWAEKSIKKGDRFYYFHAGHGTSLQDNRDFIDGSGLKNIRQTAVLLPYNYKDGDTNSLIITQNDLKPYFEKIDENVSFGLIVFDTCYAGFAYRGLGASLKKSSLVSRDIPTLFGKVDVKNYSGYPYSHLYALTASDSNHKSYEDKEQKRGIFTMALEGCIFESQKTYRNSLEMCLDRRYLKQTYKFKPLKSDANPLLFDLKSNNLVKKLIVLSNIDTKEFLDVANFRKKGVHDLELDFENGLYRLYSGGDLIGKFKDKQILKRYLSNYRVIHQKGKNGSDIEIKVSYKGSSKDNDYIKTNAEITISVTSSKEDYYIAVFSLNREGKLFMIEPVDRFNRLKDYGGKMEALTKPPIGTDFIKVFLFEKRNGLDRLKVNMDTGEVLNDSTQIEAILNSCNRNNFYEASKAIRIIGE